LAAFWQRPAVFSNGFPRAKFRILDLGFVKNRVNGYSSAVFAERWVTAFGMAPNRMMLVSLASTHA
jgi:hypothetical protein